MNASLISLEISVLGLGLVLMLADVFMPAERRRFLGYAAIAVCAFSRRWWYVLLLTTGAVGFSIYLTYIEARVLETYCIWCVTSAGIVALTEIASLIAVVKYRKRA